MERKPERRFSLLKFFKRQEKQPGVLFVQPPPQTEGSSHAAQLSELKALIDMGDHSAITPDNYPHLPQLTIAVANYYARTTQITMLSNILGESHDPKLKVQLRSKISQLKNEQDEMMAAHLPPATEEFESTDMDTPLTLTEQDWNSINAVVNAGLVEELNSERLPCLNNLKPASRRALEIQATLFALSNAKASQDQFRKTGITFGLGGDERLRKEAVKTRYSLQERGRKLLQDTPEK